MYCAVYRFQVDERCEEAVRKGDQELLPQMSNIPGFVSHFAVTVSDTEALQIAVFDDEAQANQFEQLALEWIQKSLAPQLGHPYSLPPREVIRGRVTGYTPNTGHPALGSHYRDLRTKP